MLNWKKLIIPFILVFSIILIPACSLNDPGTTSSAPPLTLRADQHLSLITLNWEPVKVTGFKEYILLQSTSDLPDNSTPTISTETTVLKRIGDSDIHSFTLPNNLLAPKLY